MARSNIETAAAPAVPGTVESGIQTTAVVLILTGVGAVLVYPGALIGAVAAALWRWLNQPPAWLRVTLPAVVALPLLALWPLLQTGWLWRDLFASSLPFHVAGVSGDLVGHSLPVEALLGPLAWEISYAGYLLSRRTLGGQIRRDRRRDKAQWVAIGGQKDVVQKLQAMMPNPETSLSTAHPRGFIRLGSDGETNRPLDLQLPQELASHVFLPGASNTGKTTTLLRLADGAIANWYGAIFIDCKGGDLGDTAWKLASQYGLPFHVVDPDDPHTTGYDICAGNGTAVANKLVGAFSYGPAAEIYKNIAMEAIPLAVEGLIAAGEPVTLERLYDVFGPRGFAIVAQHIAETPETERIRKRLRDLAASQQGIAASGTAGLQRRLGALMEGKFGPLFRADEMLDWDAVLAEPSVTYIGLSTLASSEDVELMGRVIAQDLKQVCAHRLRALRDGQQLTPVLAIFDEFAALREADQLVDLLLQARQALMPTVISTQYIPETVPLRKATLSSGLIIAHRVEGADAEDIAKQLGTRKTTELTNQVDFETGFAEKGTHKRVDGFNVSPNILRELKQGHAVVKSVPRGRHAIVHIYRD